MAELYKFFNAVETSPGVFDREYVESDFADYFGSVLSTGLLHTDNSPGMSASVEVGTLNTIVAPGKAIMKGHLYENTTPLTLTHSIPEASLDRIDRVVLRLDLRNQSRYVKLFIKEGVPSATPVAPTLQRDNFIHEISLAQIRVRKNTVQLLPTDLVDERLNQQLCGLVYSLISIPTDQLQNYINAKRAELDSEMNTALDAYLQSLVVAERQLQTDLAAWGKQWTDWFSTIQKDGFASAVDFATHKADYVKHTGYAVATGNANAYIATLNPALSAYQEGVSLRLKINVANTGASTVNVNGLGAKPIKKSNGNAVVSGNLKAGSVYTLAYDGASFILQGEGGEYGTAKASDVLIGKTIGTEDGIIEGTMLELKVSPGELLGYSYNLGLSTTSNSPVKIIGVKVLVPGAYRVVYSLRQDYDGSSHRTYGQLYVNGVAKGIQRSAEGVSVIRTYEEDIFDIKSGDEIQLYVWKSPSGFRANFISFALKTDKDVMTGTTY